MTTRTSEWRWEGLKRKRNASKMKWPACQTRLVLRWSRTHFDAEYCGPAWVKIQGRVWAMTQLQWPWPSPELLWIAAQNQVCALAGIAVSQPGELWLPGRRSTQLLFAVCLQTWEEKVASESLIYRLGVRKDTQGKAEHCLLLSDSSLNCWYPVWFKDDHCVNRWMVVQHYGMGS